MARNLPDIHDEVRSRSLFDHQEHTHAFAYWEGAMRFTGEDVQGMGYLEMTGY